MHRSFAPFEARIHVYGVTVAQVFAQKINSPVTVKDA
ncbi:MAG: hypothetical protein QG577_11 [Thermodesulfobacteriota bacterium]|nr:hypothetical protein [Thermodesulfobacteriota bacterium]